MEQEKKGKKNKRNSVNFGSNKKRNIFNHMLVHVFGVIRNNNKQQRQCEKKCCGQTVDIQ